MFKNHMTKLASAALPALAILAMVPGGASAAQKTTTSTCKHGDITIAATPGDATKDIDSDGLVCMRLKGNGDLKYVLDYSPLAK